MAIDLGKHLRPVMRRAALAALLLGAALPAAAETLGDTMVAAYRHSALLDQQRAVLRATDEDVATAMAALRPVLEWTLRHNFVEMEGFESTTTTAALTASMTLYDFGRSQAAIDAAKDRLSIAATSLVLTPATFTTGVGEPQQLTATVLPENAAGTTTYVSANPAIATVSGTGVVTGVASGTTTITATRGSVSDTSTVTVTEGI